MINHILFLLIVLQPPGPAPQDPFAGVSEARKAECRAVLEERDDKKRAEAVTNLTRRYEKSLLSFLLALGDADPSARVRGVIVERVGRLRETAVLEMLERRATSDPDAAISLQALDRLRTQQAQQLGQLFEQRLELARARGDDISREALAAEHQRWTTTARGAELPAFLQSPPPVFEALPPRASIRVMAFSDFGSPGAAQRKVAAAAAEYHRLKPFDLGLTAGDNFVMRGVTGPADPRWQNEWERLYDPLGVRFFATLGNHDWGYAESPAAEILYSSKSKSWRMPALYYSFTAGPAQFFALCTPALSETQLRWLDRELARSKAQWKIVYGHYPIYSQGSGHGDSPQLERTLLPLLRNRADVYIAGHDHDLQHLKPVDGVHFFGVGGGGQGIRPVKPGPRVLFAEMTHGFAAIEMDAGKLAVTLVNSDGEIRYHTAIAPRQRSGESK